MFLTVLSFIVYCALCVRPSVYPSDFEEIMGILDLLNSETFNIFLYGSLVKDEEGAVVATYDLGLISSNPQIYQLCWPEMVVEAGISAKKGFRWR